MCLDWERKRIYCKYTEHGQLTCCAAETKLLRLDSEVQIKGPAGLVSVRTQICLQDDIHKQVIQSHIRVNRYLSWQQTYVPFVLFFLIKDLVMHCEQIEHFLLALVECDKARPRYSNFWGWSWSRKEGSTNLQTKFYSQEEQASVIHSIPLQQRWKIGLSQRC